MIYRIYCLKNKENEIVYVGQTSRELEVRLKEHKRRYENRKEYSIELIEETDNKEKANQLEEFYIRKYNTVENGENITYGKGIKGLGGNKTSFKKGNEFCKMGTKRVICIETGVEYESITQCAKELSLVIKRISEVCRGERKSTGGLHFKFV